MEPQTPSLKQPLRELTNVPISCPYIARVQETLTAHGAAFEETKYVEADGGLSSFKAFTISFPEGTERVWGMTLSRSTRFTIVFPDGFEQPGAELWPITRTNDDQPITVLYLKKGGTHATPLS
jgi:hypothetical protein